MPCTNEAGQFAEWEPVEPIVDEQWRCVSDTGRSPPDLCHNELRKCMDFWNENEFSDECISIVSAQSEYSAELTRCLLMDNCILKLVCIDSWKELPSSVAKDHLKSLISDRRYVDAVTSSYRMVARGLAGAELQPSDFPEGTVDNIVMQVKSIHWSNASLGPYLYIIDIISDPRNIDLLDFYHPLLIW